MISVRIPARYWLLGVTLLLPFINWFLVRHHVLDFPVEDHSIQDLWANYYEGIPLYRSALSIHAAVVLLLAVLVCVFSRWVERHWHLVLNAFILAGLVASAVFSMRMAFCIDEWEHIHASWKVHNGLLPFVDFFEHHHGLMWRLFAPGIAAVEDHSSVLLLSRVFIFGFWLLTLFIVYRTALLLTGHRTSSKYAVLLLLSFYMCVWPALEFRPDNPQVTFGMLSFYFFVRYRKHGRHVDILISGMGMGVSFLFLQKALYLCAALGCYQLYLAFTRRIPWSSVAVFTGACFIPVLPVAVGYLSRGHLGEYFFFNWALNLHKAATPGSWAYMVPGLPAQPLLPRAAGGLLRSPLAREEEAPNGSGCIRGHRRVSPVSGCRPAQGLDAVLSSGVAVGRHLSGFLREPVLRSSSGALPGPGRAVCTRDEHWADLGQRVRQLEPD